MHCRRREAVRPSRSPTRRAGYALAVLLAAAGMPAGSSPPLEIAAAPDAARIAILHPGNETTVFNNEGKVDVEVALSPELKRDSGERIELLLNGAPTQSGNGTDFVLNGVERGQHRLQARVVGADGSVIAESAPVTFYLWQASRLFPAGR